MPLSSTTSLFTSFVHHNHGTFSGTQNFLICIEMFFAAWAHWVYFSANEFDASLVSALEAEKQANGPQMKLEQAPNVQSTFGWPAKCRGNLNMMSVAIVLMHPVHNSHIQCCLQLTPRPRCSRDGRRRHERHADAAGRRRRGHFAHADAHRPGRAGIDEIRHRRARARESAIRCRQRFLLLVAFLFVV